MHSFYQHPEEHEDEWQIAANLTPLRDSIGTNSEISRDRIDRKDGMGLASPTRAAGSVRAAAGPEGIGAKDPQTAWRESPKSPETPSSLASDGTSSTASSHTQVRESTGQTPVVKPKEAATASVAAKAAVTATAQAPVSPL